MSNMKPLLYSFLKNNRDYILLKNISAVSQEIELPQLKGAQFPSHDVTGTSEVQFLCHCMIKI